MITDKTYRLISIEPVTTSQSSKDVVQLVRDKFIHDITSYLRIGSDPVLLNKFITTCRGDGQSLQTDISPRIQQLYKRLTWKNSNLVYNYNASIQTLLQAASYPTYAVVHLYVCKSVPIPPVKLNYSNLLCTISVLPDAIHFTNELLTTDDIPDIVQHLGGYIRHYADNFPEGIQNEVIVKTVPYE